MRKFKSFIAFALAAVTMVSMTSAVFAVPGFEIPDDEFPDDEIFDDEIFDDEFPDYERPGMINSQPTITSYAYNCSNGAKADINRTVDIKAEFARGTTEIDLASVTTNDGKEIVISAVPKDVQRGKILLKSNLDIEIGLKKTIENVSTFSAVPTDVKVGDLLDGKAENTKENSGIVRDFFPKMEGKSEWTESAFVDFTGGLKEEHDLISAEVGKQKISLTKDELPASYSLDGALTAIDNVLTGKASTEDKKAYETLAERRAFLEYIGSRKLQLELEEMLDESSTSAYCKYVKADKTDRNSAGETQYKLNKDARVLGIFTTEGHNKPICDLKISIEDKDLAESLGKFDSPGVYTVDENGNLEYVMTYLNKDVITFYPPHFSTFIITDKPLLVESDEGSFAAGEGIAICESVVK